MSLLQEILKWDRELFQTINGKWTNPTLDFFLTHARSAIIWVPFYLFFVVFMIINYKRSGLFWLLFGILTVATADMISSRVIKELFYRLRPCRDESMAGHVRLLASYCGLNSSFTSSHAANHFAMATFIFLTLKSEVGKWIWLIFFWAFLIGYAQIYVGVHYPMDILSGALLGMGIGYLWTLFFKRHFFLERSSGQ